MKHEQDFTQTDQTQTSEVSLTISTLFLQDRNIKLGWIALCTLLCTIALILECINVTLNKLCNHQNNQTTVSLLKTIPQLLPVHSETPKDLCAERNEFPLRVSNKRVNVCTYQDRIRVDPLNSFGYWTLNILLLLLLLLLDVREFINDRETIKDLYFTSREFISFNGALPFLRHEVLLVFYGMLQIVHTLSSFRVAIISCHHVSHSTQLYCVRTREKT